ncbi:MAG: energy-coupling factor transporter ATPase [Clostridia bacterium]|nr:energy-coupling factor transporter ATPase [Clostridia bacterium]
MMEIIKTENLTFGYEDSQKKVLEQFNLTIEKGSFTALLGHNGSGKSSLAKLFNAVLLPTGGTVYVSGMDTKNEALLLEIRKNCGLVFQNPDNQLVASIIEDDVAFAPENLGVPSEEIRKRVDDALKCVGMYEYRLSSPQHLSGGQKQRVAIAGIVAMRPSVIVLDEPTAMLDPRGRKEVVETILRLNREYGITAILITHNMEEAALADRIVVMEKGKILLDGTPEEIFSQYEILKKTGLDVPQITELSYQLHQAGLNIDSCILSVDELVEQITKVL